MNDTLELVLEETILDETLRCKFDTNPAAWLAGCRKCPRRSIWCEEHYDWRMNSLPYALSHECRECGAVADSFDELFFVVPI